MPESKNREDQAEQQNSEIAKRNKESCTKTQKSQSMRTEMHLGKEQRTNNLLDSKNQKHQADRTIRKFKEVEESCTKIASTASSIYPKQK